MARAINNTSDFERYVNTLESTKKKMIDELEVLKKSYERSKWNDMISEKVGNELNAYIKEFNSAMQILEGAICSLKSMEKQLSEYSKYR